MLFHYLPCLIFPVLKKKKLLLNKWKNQEFYIGEWHFHPNGTTTPSPQDFTQLSEISESNRYNCPEPIMIIVAGTPSKFEIQPYILIPGMGCQSFDKE